MDKLTPELIKVFDAGAVHALKQVVSVINETYGSMDHLTDENKGRYMVFFHGIKELRDSFLRAINEKEEKKK